jgi:hypothetical protein
MEISILLEKLVSAVELKDSQSGLLCLINSYVIEYWDLRDLEISRRCFTWSNNQVDPIFEKLDRFLVSTDWEKEYPFLLC